MSGHRLFIYPLYINLDKVTNLMENTKTPAKLYIYLYSQPLGKEVPKIYIKIELCYTQAEYRTITVN